VPVVSATGSHHVRPKVTPAVPMSTTDQFRYTLVAGATAVVIGIGFTLVGLDRHAAGADAPATRSAQVPLVAAPAPQGSSPADGSLFDEASPSTPASPSASATSKPKPKPKVTTTAPRPKPKPPTVPQTSGSVLERALAHINAARTAEGLSTLSLDANLSKAAALHNQRMINGCGLSHQCSGEGGIGERFSAQGVRWSSAGENIGFGSAGSSESAILRAANGLTDRMLAETPPDDGHRRNLLSKSFKRIGLSIVRDSNGRVWLTQDFVG
jgi:uncharacterized protein YkwD